MFYLEWYIFITKLENFVHLDILITHVQINLIFYSGNEFIREMDHNNFYVMKEDCDNCATLLLALVIPSCLFMSGFLH